jgi:DNA-binding NarL/FixJ family response regulator
MPSGKLTTQFALTPRENDVMRCFANGRLYKETGDELGISFSKVHKHANNVFRKLHVGNRTEAIMKWRNGWISASSVVIISIASGL